MKPILVPNLINFIGLLKTDCTIYHDLIMTHHASFSDELQAIANEKILNHSKKAFDPH